MDRTVNPLVVDPFMVSTIKAKTSAGVIFKSTSDATCLTLGPGGGCSAAFGDGATFQGTVSATHTGGIQTQQAATQDAIRMIGRAGGTGSYIASVTPPSLSASITLTLPAIDGTLVALNGTNTWSGTQVFQDQITTEAIVRDMREVTSAAGTTALDATDHIVIVIGTTTETLTLVACATGRELILANDSTGNVTVNRAGSDTIGSAAETSIVLTPGDRLTLRGSGTVWRTF
jgi:hypothetical protein